MLETHIKNVKTLIATYDSRMKAVAPGEAAYNQKTYEFNLRWVNALNNLLEYLDNQERLNTPIPKSLGDISDLPPELLKELSVKKVDELDGQILTVFRACGGEANLDQVLVGLWRSFQVCQTRRFIQNKLYRMAQRELIFPIPGQRAAYSLEAKTDEGTPAATMTVETFDTSEMDDDIPF